MLLGSFPESWLHSGGSKRLPRVSRDGSVPHRSTGLRLAGPLQSHPGGDVKAPLPKLRGSPKGGTLSLETRDGAEVAAPSPPAPPAPALLLSPTDKEALSPHLSRQPRSGCKGRPGGRGKDTAAGTSARVQQPGMGATGWTPTRLCRLACAVGIFFFLLLLCFSSLRLQVPSSTCIWGVRPCRWFGGTLPSKEDAERKPPPSASPPSAATGAALLLQTPSEPPDPGEGFRVARLQRAFAASLTPGGQILIREYLSGWKELIKLMDALGAAFGLISGETRTKIAILQENQRGPHGAHYRTLQSMVRFELARGLVGFQSLPAGRPPSGCRTLLRLHRALKWLELFLRKLGTSAEGAEPSRMCADAYQEALAPYHSWWVRQAAALAFLAMPSRRELYRILSAGGGGEEEEEGKGLRRLRDTVRSIAHVYNATQELYAAHGMLALP